MTKRTRAEFELFVLPSDIESAVGIATSEVQSEVAEGCLKEFPLTVGIPESHVPARVATADVEVEKGSGDEVAHATEAAVGEVDTNPFWALLFRAGYEFV